MNRWILGAAALAVGLPACFLFAASDLSAQRAPAWQPSIVGIPSPASSNSGEPQLTASDRGVLLSWIEHEGSKTTLRFAERTASGWTEPHTAAAGDNWSVNPIDVPSVLRLAGGTLVANWLQSSGSGMHANDVRVSYSKDEGRTWSPSFTPYPAGTQTERLFASLFEMPRTGLGLIWLEGLAMPSGTSESGSGEHNHPSGADHVQPQSHAQPGHEGHGGRAGSGTVSGSGAMSLRFASFDSAWKQTAAMPIDLRVCECCSTAACSRQMAYWLRIETAAMTRFGIFTYPASRKGGGASQSECTRTTGRFRHARSTDRR